MRFGGDEDRGVAGLAVFCLYGFEEPVMVQPHHDSGREQPWVPNYQEREILS